MLRPPVEPGHYTSVIYSERLASHGIAPPSVGSVGDSFDCDDQYYGRECDRILAAVELGLSSSKLEGLNSKFRFINHRVYSHRSAAVLISMIYLRCGDHLPAAHVKVRRT